MYTLYKLLGWLVAGALAVTFMAIAVMPSYTVVRFVHKHLRGRLRPGVWILLLLATLAWCALAAWDANNMGKVLVEATRPMPAVGADIAALFGLFFLHMP